MKTIGCRAKPTEDVPIPVANPANPAPTMMTRSGLIALGIENEVCMSSACATGGPIRELPIANSIIQLVPCTSGWPKREIKVDQLGYDG